MNIKKIDFKQKKYVLPLLALPFLMLFGYVGAQFTKEPEKTEEKPKELSLSLGESGDSILNKNEAYDEFFKKDDNRTMLDGLDKENDSMMQYSDQLSYKQKRYIDSLKMENQERINAGSGTGKSYYNRKENMNDDKDFKRSAEIMRMLNGQNNSPNSNYANSVQKFSNESSNLKNENDDPVKTLKKQMLMMDSLEKARDPEYQTKLAAEQKLKANKDKMEAFLNSTFNVSKSGINNSFNAVYKDKEISFIKAVIDENNKGYLGSRIRFRILEDIFIKDKKILKGTVLYGQISGFTMQRVELSIVSILCNGEILPINLSIYDVDGLKGLYVPQSIFREMMKELGTNSIQGNSLDSGNEGFFTSLATKLFTSTSTSIANLIKKNKAKLKYNSYVFLINEKELKGNNKQK